MGATVCWAGTVPSGTRVPLGAVPAQHTVTPSALVTVPDGYNYYVDAVLWRDGVHVDSARSVANLDPSERISADETEEEVEFEASDFESDAVEETSRERGAEADGTSEQTPGFGLAVGLVAVLATALLARRRST